MFKLLWLVLVGLLLPCSAALAASCPASTWYTLINGTTADASQVMSNFACMAPLDGPTFTASVGIGTTAPGAKLQVGGTTATAVSNAVLIVGTGAASNAIQLDSYSDNTKQFALTNFNGSITETVPQNYLLQGSNNYAGSITISAVGSGGSGYVILQPSGGNVGIGTATPATTLSVVGDIRIGNSGSNGCLQNFAGGILA